jgi:RNA polymerase sigma factor FliA
MNLPASSCSTDGTLAPAALDATWRAYRSSRDVASREALMEHYLPTVKYFCEWYHDRLPREIDIDEVTAAGLCGLRAALDAFNPDLGVRFETYCNARMRGAIRDYLRSIDQVPRAMRAHTNHLKRCREELTAALHRTPSDTDVADYMGLSAPEFNRLAAEATSVHTISLDSTPPATDAGAFRMINTLTDTRTEDPAASAHRADLKRLFLKCLSPRERRILILYYYEECTLSEVATVLGITESRVSQLHQSILHRLQESLGRRQQDMIG